MLKLLSFNFSAKSVCAIDEFDFFCSRGLRHFPKQSKLSVNKYSCSRKNFFISALKQFNPCVLGVHATRDVNTTENCFVFHCFYFSVLFNDFHSFDLSNSFSVNQNRKHKEHSVGFRLSITANQPIRFNFPYINIRSTFNIVNI